MYLNGDNHKKLNQYLTKEYITEHLTSNTERISLEFTLEEEKLFTQLSDLDYIQEKLNKNGKFDFTLHQHRNDGSMGVFKYYFRYFDTKYRTVLCAVTDITEESHLDSLTQQLNLDGFIQEIDKVLRTSESPNDFAILHFDIKAFKAINKF